jgi:hypothetical protein
MRLWLALLEDVPAERVDVAWTIAHAIQGGYLEIGREQRAKAAKDLVQRELTQQRTDAEWERLLRTPAPPGPAH